MRNGEDSPALAFRQGGESERMSDGLQCSRLDNQGCVPMINYFLLIMAAVVGIVVFDDDPSGVSIQEWVLFAVMLYALRGLLISLRKFIRENT